MSRKRRMFEIDFTEEPPQTPAAAPAAMPAVPAGTLRKSPMASAIAENAGALEARQAAEAAIRAENDALAHELVRLKKAGLVTDLVDIDLIDAEKLIRDRAQRRDDEIDDLKQSIRDVGLSNPIRVEAKGERFELIQGYRRLTAWRELRDEVGAEYARIPAVLVARGEALLRLYRQMVDENMVRRGVSFAELAQVAIAYRNSEPELESHDQAVELLYASSGRQKRVYIRNFCRLLTRLDGALNFPELLPRALGLDLLKRLEEERKAVASLTARLRARPDRDGEEELAILQAFVREKPGAGQGARAVRAKARTTFRLTRPEGVAKCTAADGRVELRLDRDFSELERARLERAAAAFFAALDEE